MFLKSFGFSLLGLTWFYILYSIKYLLSLFLKQTYILTDINNSKGFCELKIIVIEFSNSSDLDCQLKEKLSKKSITEIDLN